MKRSEIRVGGIYWAKVSDQVVRVRVLEIVEREKSRYRRGGTSYRVLNLRTNREVIFRSVMRFRFPASHPPTFGPQTKATEETGRKTLTDTTVHTRKRGTRVPAEARDDAPPNVARHM